MVGSNIVLQCIYGVGCAAEHVEDDSGNLAGMFLHNSVEQWTNFWLAAIRVCSCTTTERKCPLPPPVLLKHAAEKKSLAHLKKDASNRVSFRVVRDACACQTPKYFFSTLRMSKLGFLCRFSDTEVSLFPWPMAGDVIRVLTFISFAVHLHQPLLWARCQC